jgi:hypothetical protein
MGMRIVVTNPSEVTAFIIGMIPTHTCGMFGRQADENFGSALARRFPKAFTYRHGDSMTLATLRVDGDKISTKDAEIIMSAPYKLNGVHPFWDYINASRIGRLMSAMARIAKAAEVIDPVSWIGVRDDVDNGNDHVVILNTGYYALSPRITLKKLRNRVRKDDYRLLLSGGLDYSAISLRPF